MDDLWVVNASPIIALGKIGLLHLAARLARDIVVPAGVVREILAGPEDEAATALRGATFGRVVAAPPLDAAIVRWDLGRGESEVIALARQLPRSIAIVDDRAARACCNAFGIRTRGTVGVVVAARCAGQLELPVRTCIGRLREAGFRVSMALESEALIRAGER